MLTEKRFILGIIAAIVLTIVISVAVWVSSYNEDKEYVLGSADTLNESNELQAKEQYDTKEMKQEFLDIASSLSSNIYSKILNGTVTDDESLKEAIEKYNKILESDNWDTFDMIKSSKWLGKWYLNEQGFLKFKFSKKTIEPSWITDEDVLDYIVKN